MNLQKLPRPLPPPQIPRKIRSPHSTNGPAYQSYLKVRTALATAVLMIIATLTFLSLIIPYQPPPSSLLWPLLQPPPLSSSSHLASLDRQHLFLDPFAIDETAPNHNRSYVFSKAAVSSDVPRCSTMAADILKQGGSAVDAAVTLALCLGSINSFSSGIGGGGFMVVAQNANNSKAFNFRERAPAAAHKNMFKGNPFASKVGGLAVAIPGELAGLYAAFEQYSSGKLSWADLIRPVADLNRNGFVVTEPLAHALTTVESVFIQAPENWNWLLTNAPLPPQDGQPPDLGHDSVGHTKVDKKTPPKGTLRTKVMGEIVRRPAFAATLDLIAQNGSAAIFYDPNGPIAPNLVNAIQKSGGIATTADFANYSVEITSPQQTTLDLADGVFRKVYTMHNPSSGPVLLFGLNVMEELHKKWGKTGSAEDQNTPGNSNNHWLDFEDIATQRLVETMKWMGASRSRLGDSADLNNSAAIAQITSKSFSSKIAWSNVSDSQTHPWQYYDPAYESVDPHGTTHFSIVDENGLAVAMTTTVNLYFGALVADPVTGVLFNNEMDDFSVPGTSNSFNLAPSIYNYVAPYKRPLSSCSPTIITAAHAPDGHDEAVEMVIGASGGSRILTTVLQTIVRKLFYRTSLAQAIQSPRIHHQLLPHVAELEVGTPAHAAHALAARGHKVKYGPPGSVSNGIYRDLFGRERGAEHGKISAVADWWRKRGAPAGY